MFTFDGKSYPFEEGDTIGSALYRTGMRIFSRSFKYHRPRGLLCVSGKCPNCMVNVDGIPNVRSCTEPVCDGMKVTHQNAVPSLEHDVLSAAGLVDWLMPIGFYYKTFTHPDAWRFVEPLIRRAAGLGVIEYPHGLPTNIEAHDPGKGKYEHVNLHSEHAVIGGGPAGMRAALEAAKQGKNITLVDDQQKLGGHLSYSSAGADEAQMLDKEIRSQSNIHLLQNAACFGFYEGNLLAIVQKHRGSDNLKLQESLIHLRAKKITIATGSFEIPLVFQNNDLVGVMLSTGVQRLINLHGIKPGETAVVVSSDSSGGEVAEDLKRVGVEVAEVLPPDEVVAATGRKRVTGIRTTEHHIRCDLIVVCGMKLPEAGLLAQAGAKVVWDEEKDNYVPIELPPDVFAEGEVSGETFLASGKPNGSSGSLILPSAFSRGGKSFVCFCEDVTAKDLRQGIEEGFDHIQTLKRYSTATMGPCQGKMCHLAAAEVCAKETGQSLVEVGRTTSRPPNPSVSLGALAGARHHPVKLTPFHHKNVSLGAVFLDMGEWKRPRFYRSSKHSELTDESIIEQEYRAVRERVGMVDVSTLGRLDVKGKDAGQLLDKVYTNQLSNLRPGRMRYSVICDDTGTILDDGTISRLADDHYFITTTTGNIDFVQQWLDWWKVGAGWCAHVTDITAGLAGMNVAGPLARDVLKNLTDQELDKKAFPYMACREAVVAGVNCLMLRIGFVGETGWEIHFPAEYAEYLWDVVLEAGKEFGIRPFGVEAQRILRLEKKHVIVGADTDATSNPLGADMEWVARMEKDDFIGKAAILRLKNTGIRERLVGFELESRVGLEDGSMLVHNGQPAGRVTSVRFSHINGKTVGMAWVSTEVAEIGGEVQIEHHGHPLTARIVGEAFYDPEGKRVRM